MMRRAGTAVALLTLLVMAFPTAANAVGAQGVDLTPLLERRDGLLTGVVEDETVVGLRLNNTAEDARTVSVSAILAERDAAGDYALGQEVSWITIDGATDVTLAGGETRILEAHIDLAGYREAGEPGTMAFLLQVNGNGSLVLRAATIVALHDSGAALPMPVALLLLSASLTLLVGLAWVRTVRRYGLHPVAAT